MIRFVNAGTRPVQPRVGRELAAMVLLVRDAVVHPGQARAHLPVEAADELQHVELARLADLRLALAVGAAQRLEQLLLRAVRGDAAAVLLQKALEGLALEVAVRPRELARHHQVRFDDVAHELGDRARLFGRPERERLVGNGPELVDDARARVRPGFERLVEQ